MRSGLTIPTAWPTPRAIWPGWPRRAAMAPRSAVEKILEGDERLPDWACHGTTGYDAAAVIDTALVDPATVGAVNEAWAATRRGLAAGRGRGQQTAGPRRAAAARTESAASGRDGRDARTRRRRPARSAGRLLVQVHVYRAYVTPGNRRSALVEPLHERARPGADGSSDLATVASELVGVLAASRDRPGDQDAARDLCVRFQQTTGPVMAKGIEDTAFYRCHRLTALNEVGFDPATGEHPGVSDLHAWAAHQASAVAAWHDHPVHPRHQAQRGRPGTTPGPGR